MQTRIKSSFIYLANAVNDLRSNWKTLAIVLLPAAILAALCLLPDALNVQHGLVEHFTPGPGTHNVIYHAGWRLAQEPYDPAAELPPPPLFSNTQILVAHGGLWILTLIVNLLVLCTIRRSHEVEPAAGLLTRPAAIFRMAIGLAPAYAWVALLHYAVPMVGLIVTRIHFLVSSAALAVLLNFVEAGMIIAGTLVYLWLFFAPYALIFDGRHSFHALLFSRDLIRKRFFRVTTRIAVFLSIWWGYDSLAAVVFTVASLIVGPVAVLTGSVWTIIYLLDLGVVMVHFATNAFFIAAGLRLYRDLRADSAGSQSAKIEPGLAATLPLEPMANPAAG
jgi:hypothetical protein